MFVLVGLQHLSTCLSAGVPLEPSAQRSAGRCEGSVEGGETLGGAADRHRAET